MPAIPQCLKSFYDNYFLTTPAKLWTFSSFKSYCKSSTRPRDLPEGSNLRYHFHACLKAIIHHRPPFHSSTVFNQSQLATDEAVAIARHICHRLKQRSEEHNARKRKRLPFKMETNVQPNVNVSAKQESTGNSFDVSGISVPVNVNLSPKLSQEPDTLNPQRQRSRKRARRDRSLETESSNASQTGAEQNSSVAESSNKDLNKTGLDQPRQSSEVDTLYEPEGAHQEQPPKYDNLSNNEQDDTLEFYTPADTPLPIVYVPDEPNDEYADVDAPTPNTGSPVYHQDDTLEGALSRPNTSTSAAAAAADVTQTKKSTKLDLELPSSGRSLGAVVSEYVSSLRDDERRQQLSEWIAQAEKSVYFPGKMNALIDEILSPDDTAYLLSLSMWLPPGSPAFDAMLSANMRGWDRKAATQWLPTTIEYPTGYENWDLELWDMWHYVHYAMGYFSRYLAKFTAAKKEHSEGWWDANVWTYIFDHAYQSSENLNLERKEIQSIIDKPHPLDTEITPHDMIAAAMGKRRTRPSHHATTSSAAPPKLIPMPKYDGIVSYTPDDPNLPRFDLCFLEVKSGAANDQRQALADRNKVLRAMRRTLIIIRGRVRRHTPQQASCNNINTQVDKVMAGVAVGGVLCNGLTVTFLVATNPCGKVVLMRDLKYTLSRATVEHILRASWGMKMLLEKTALLCQELFEH